LKKQCRQKWGMMVDLSQWNKLSIWMVIAFSYGELRLGGIYSCNTESNSIESPKRICVFNRFCFLHLLWDARCGHSEETFVWKASVYYQIDNKQIYNNLCNYFYPIDSPQLSFQTVIIAAPHPTKVYFLQSSLSLFSF
jgi:hypothetical protein